MERPCIIQWVNKWSNERGYVKKISVKERHFTNTCVETEAKRYKSRAVARREIDRLTTFGEAENNDFHILEV